MSENAQPVIDMGRRANFKARLRTVFATVSSVTGIAFLWRILVARHGVRILTYHGVEPRPSSPFSVSVEAFEQQIAFLAANFEVVDLATLRKWQKGDYSPTRPMVVLTFDDGFKNNLQFAAPVLRRHDLPATFFVISGKLDGGDERFMTTAQLREILDCPEFGIGSHTANHRSVSQIDDSGRDIEIRDSKVRLEAALDRRIGDFCFPYGTFNDFDDRSVSALIEHGYEVACTSVNGINLRSTNPHKLRRTKVEWSDDMATFKRLLNGAMDGWFFLDFFLRFLQRPRMVNFESDGRTAGKAG